MSNSEKMKVQFFQLKSYVLILAVVWTIIFAVSLAWNTVEIEYNALNSARIQARAAYKKDILYRRWNAGYGGVYVPVTKKTQPNPYLSGIPERDITTPSGRTLTLMNPAYMTRQVHELAKEEYGVLGHITSLNPIRPQNAPDPWEIKALEEFERGRIEVSSAEKIEGKEFMRLMRPLITERGCLKCHATQGYQEGDIRGGISVSVPMGSLLAIAHGRIIGLVLGHGILWILGLSGIVLGAQRLTRSERERKRAQEELRKHKEYLEELVEERTAQLKKTNEQLRKEIVERKQAEEKIQQQYKFLNTVLESLTHPFYVIDVNDYTVKMANSAARVDFGNKLAGKQACYMLSHMRDKPCDTTDHPCPIEEIKRTGKPVVVEHIHYDKNANLKYVEVDGYPIFDDKGNIREIIESTLDITERKEAEQLLQRTYDDLARAHHQLKDSQAQLIQTEKMSALGTLVAGTAHELNNPLTAILNFSAHCRKHTSRDNELYPILEDIEHKTKRCAEIVRNLLTFSHAEQDDDKVYQKASLAEILGRVLKLLSYRIEKQRISVTQHIADDIPEICMKPNSIQQLILNLATNALDALEGSEKKELNVDIHREDEFVRMTISDTGCGIPAEHLGAVFDPFFTTKPVGQGTGLGLAVSQGIVKAHGGQISCESEPGEGTKFSILLPIEKKERSKQYEQANISN